jgi:hypothetical protein
MSTPNFESFATKELVKEIEHRLELKIEQTKAELIKSNYWLGFIQYLAMAATLIGIVSFMIKK